MAASKPRSVLVVVAGIMLLLVGVGIGWWAWGGSAGQRDSRGTTFGTLLAVLGLLLTLAGWFIPATSRRPVTGTSQQAGRGSVQAGGHITGAVATGRGADATAPAPPAPAHTAGERSPDRIVGQQAGAGAVQAAGDITGAVATGKNAQAGMPPEPSHDDAHQEPDGDPPGTS